MKKIFLMLLVAVSLVACDKGGKDTSSKTITVPDQQQLTQTVYADDNAGKRGVTFKTTGAWTSEIKESATAKSTRTAMDWVSISPSSGDKAGDYTINISLLTNFTGEKRSATISLKCRDEIVNIVITQEAVTELGEKPKPDPKPSGSGTLKNETTGESVKLVLMKHEIETPERVRIKFFSEGEKGHEFLADFYNPLQSGKLKSGVYNIKLFNTYPAPESVNGDCEWYKSSLGDYGTSGTIKVEINNDIYTFTFGIQIRNTKLTGSFTGVPEYINKEVKVESISLDHTSKTLEMGENFSLKATINPENATDKRHIWSSSNPAVATVSENGLVQSVAKGITTITATSKEGVKTATCVVTVNPPVAVTGIKVEPAEVTILEGGYLMFNMDEKITILPKNATNKKFSWKSSDEKIAVYTGKGIETKAAGVANITFTTDDGSKTANLKVTVTEREAYGSGLYTTHDPSGKYQDRSYTISQISHTIISKDRVDLLFTTKKGEEVLNLRLNNPLANGRLATGSYICTLNENATNGTLYHLRNYDGIGYFNSGTVTVSANGDNYSFTANNVKTSNGFTVSLSYTGALVYTNQYVDVRSVTLDKTTLSLTIGHGSQLIATVNPNNASNKNVKWSSSNSNVASVSDNGYVYSTSVGTTTITVTSEDGAKTATCQVTVNALPSTGSGTFSNNKNQSLTITRAEQWVNGKDPKEINIRLAKANSAYYDLSFTLIRATNDTGALKAGTYTVIRQLMVGELGVKYSYENTGSATIALSGENYTITLDVTSSDSTKIKGSYTGKIVSTQ